MFEAGEVAGQQARAMQWDRVFLNMRGWPETALAKTILHPSSAVGLNNISTLSC